MVTVEQVRVFTNEAKAKAAKIEQERFMHETETLRSALHEQLGTSFPELMARIYGLIKEAAQRGETKVSYVFGCSTIESALAYFIRAKLLGEGFDSTVSFFRDTHSITVRNSLVTYDKAGYTLTISW